MNKKIIKEDVRKFLLETSGTHEFGCVMLYLNISDKDWKVFQDEIDDDDVYNGDGYGREEESHVTILYGLHATISDDTIKELVNDLVAPELKLRKISIFEQDKFDVVKFDIIGESKEQLSKMNAKFVKLPHTNSYPDYTPHATIAYVKSGTGKKYIRNITEDIITIKPTKVTYSKADGTKINYKIK